MVSAITPMSIYAWDSADAKRRATQKQKVRPTADSVPSQPAPF